MIQAGSAETLEDVKQLLILKQDINLSFKSTGRQENYFFPCYYINEGGKCFGMVG
ncbi:MAG: hypothetical protein PHI04_03290 [Clostridiaceae bacterium]|nr:hypothetical protein [Clostridiaceae bacterium]